MSQTKQEIVCLLAEAGTEPRHRFGQNFMIDQNLLRIVADAGRIEPGDLVIEVGPGTGSLTEELLARVAPGGRVVAVEIDRDLAGLLRTRFSGRDDFTLIEADALAGKHQLNPELLSVLKEGRRSVKLVANLPYNIASPLVIELLMAGVGHLAFTVQKEVADRLRRGGIGRVRPAFGDGATPLARAGAADAAAPGLLAGAQDRFGARPPHPRRPACAQANPFSVFVHKLFSFRRKTLRKALAQAGCDAHALLAATGLDGQLRPEAFTPEQILTLYLAGIQPPGQ